MNKFIAVFDNILILNYDDDDDVLKSGVNNLIDTYLKLNRTTLLTDYTFYVSCNLFYNK